MSIDNTRDRFEPLAHRGVTYQESGPLQRLFGGLFRHWQRRRMIRMFRAMDDRLLRDIGLERGDIEDMVASFDDRELRMVPVDSAVVVLEADLPAYAKAA